MREDTTQTKRIDERRFNSVRKGYDPKEVNGYLEELELAFQDMEGHSRRASQRIVELERDLAAARATEKASLDNAMLAVFDVKDRMIDRAARRAKEIEDQADKTASSLLAQAAASQGREHELETRVSRLEQELIKTRADGERLRMQLNDAHTALDQIETTTTVDITSLQAQLDHERQQNNELRKAARDVDWLRREFEHKLATAQEKAMRAQADAEAARAELKALEASPEAEKVDGKVVYQRTDELADYEFAVASLESGNGALRDAI